MSLFRTEAVEHQMTRLDGAVVLSQPIRTEVLSAFLAAVAIGAVAWLATGNYARTETVRGVLMTDVPVAKILPPAEGVVTSVQVEEGSIVTRGQILAVVDVDRRDAGGSLIAADELHTVDERLTLARDQLGIASAHDANERLRLRAQFSGDERKLADVDVQIGLQQNVVTSNESLFSQLGPVVERGFVSRVTFEQRRQSLLAAKQTLANLKEQREVVASDLAETKASLADLAVSRSKEANDVATSVQVLAEERARASGEQSYTLVAPISGKVTALQTGIGRGAKAGLPLMIIVPTKAMVYASLYAPSRAIGFVKPGQEVRLHYDAFPYERFGSFRGTVTSVSATSIDPRDLDVPLKLDEPVYRVAVTPLEQSVQAYEAHPALQPGMTLGATLVLERRSFLGWFLEPLRAVMRRSR